MSAQTFGNYQLLKKLATGGMAEVWLARKVGIEGFQRLVVIKRILPHLAEDPEFVQMFLNEARIAARFSHPNIAQIYDLGEVSGTYYIAMEFVHGEDLGRVMRKAWSTGQWIARPLAIRIVASACEGLSYAHAKTDDLGRPMKVVHRDISPQNILISFDGSVKVVDFGIAKAADSASLTKSGAIKGKFAYMSPEQAAGKPLDHRSDIFALGLVLYELLTGVRPLKRESELATLQAALSCQIDKPSAVADVEQEMDAAVMRALAKAADDRYRDARQFQMALEELLMTQRWVATSVQISELMTTLFAERLEEEQKLGHPEPVAESRTDAPPAPPEPPTDSHSNTEAPEPDVGWEAPPGEPQESRTRAGRPQSRSREDQPAVEPWDAPPSLVVPRRREPRASSAALARSPSATVVPRTGSQTDIPRRSTGGTPARRTMTRIAPADDPEDELPPERPPRRSRTSNTQVPRTSSRTAIPQRRFEPEPEPDFDEDDDDDGLLGSETIAEPPPPRRRTGETRARRNSRLDMRSLPPGPPMPPEPDDDEDSEGDYGPRTRAILAEVAQPRRLKKPPKTKRPPKPPKQRAEVDPEIRKERTRLLRVRIFWALVGLAMVGALYHFSKPIWTFLNERPINGQSIRLTVKSNIPLQVSVLHKEPNAAEPITMLGHQPLVRVRGAHIGDVIRLENQQLGVRDDEPIQFGQPGGTKVINKEFHTGRVQLRFRPRGLKRLELSMNGHSLGSPDLSPELIEGKHTLEVSGPELARPYDFDVTIVPNQTVRPKPIDLRPYLK